MVDSIQNILGLGADTLTWWQMGLRSLIVYPAALGMVRIGEKRFLGRSSAFDVILAIVLGSVVSRAINTGAGFFETLFAGTVLVTVHWVFAVIAFHSDRLGNLLKGSPRRLVRGGTVLWDEMRKSHITRQDLEMALRRQGGTTELADVEGVWLERSGDFSVLKAQGGGAELAPQIVDIRVEQGMQIVRVEFRRS